MANSTSILGSVAQLERELLAKLDEADRSAEAIIDDARSDARKHAEEEAAKLGAEVSAIRREAEAKRNAAFEAVLGESEKKLEALRASARGKASGVARDVLKLILPKTSGGSAS